MVFESQTNVDPSKSYAHFSVLYMLCVLTPGINAQCVVKKFRPQFWSHDRLVEVIEWFLDF